MIRLEVLDGPDALAVRAAEVIASVAEEAVDFRGRFAWAISGGTTPLATFRLLALPWDRTATFQVDERVAPAGHEDRNLTHAAAALPAEGAATIRAIPVEAEDLDRAAADYAAALPERFDLVQLGLGEDGHTASLVPGDPVLEVRDRDVAVTGEYGSRRRMTLTYPVLDRARLVLWIVGGAAKAGVLRRLVDGDPSIPAGRVATERQLALADRASVPEPPHDEPSPHA